MLFPCEVPLQLLQLIELITEKVSLILTVHVLLLQELLEFPAVRFGCLHQHDIGLAEVDDLIVKSIDHQLIVAVDGSLGEAEEQSLGNVVLPVEI